jgi:hypothetical protein
MLLVGGSTVSSRRRRRRPWLGVVVEEQRHLHVGVDGVSELQVLANGSEGSRAAQLAGPKRLGANCGNDAELPGGKDAKFLAALQFLLLPLLSSFPASFFSFRYWRRRLGVVKRLWRPWVLKREARVRREAGM